MSDNLIKAEERMLKAIENLESNLKTIRTGRASSQILERVQVDYYGSMMPINQLSSIQVVEGTQLVVKPYDLSLIHIWHASLSTTQIYTHVNIDYSSKNIIVLPKDVPSDTHL